MIESAIITTDAGMRPRAMRAEQARKPPTRAKVLLLGVAYKQDIDDYREALVGGVGGPGGPGGRSILL